MVNTEVTVKYLKMTVSSKIERIKLFYPVNTVKDIDVELANFQETRIRRKKVVKLKFFWLVKI